MSYYSLISSLPNIYLGCENPISYNDFINSCNVILKNSEIEIIQSLFNNTINKDNHIVLTKWENIEIQIKNNLAKYRAQILNIDSKQYLKNHYGYSGEIDNSIQSILNTENPGEIEKKIDQFKIKLLEELIGDYFSFEKIIVYAIQLKIILKWNDMDDEKGYNNLENIINENTKSEKILL